jgi:hypothetical protein
MTSLLFDSFSHRVPLDNEHEYRTVIWQHQESGDTEAIAFFQETLANYVESARDKRAKNYRPENLKLNEFREFGYIFHRPSNEIQSFCGLQKMTQDTFRVGSRAWINPKWRRSLFRTVENNMLVKIQLKRHQAHCPFLFASRETGPGSIQHFLRYDVFEKFKLWPEPIELRSRNNHQWIIYHSQDSKKTTSFIEQLRYKS